MDFAAVIVAAGSGSRIGGPPKQWRVLGGRTVVRWSVAAFAAAGARRIVVVAAPDQMAQARGLFAQAEVTLVPGGATRTASVLAGLAQSGSAEIVMIHDAARPFLTTPHIAALLQALETADGALPALPVADTLKRREDERIVTVDRAGMWRAQTPQAFRRSILERAYAAWPADAPATDDAAVVEAIGGRIAFIPGDPRLDKITLQEDLDMAEAIAAHGQQRITRVGQGFDAHRFGPGDGVWLCGVKIAHDLALIGHSDADAGLHALTDAVLGAMGLGDIGDHFPPSDPQWRGAASEIFLKHALKLMAAKGGRLANLDVTLICEQPRIKPHREAMRARLAEITGLTLDRISVKATTTEGLGFTGRSEGLAAQAIVAVDAPA